MVEVDGIKTHALLDTGAGSSYASSSLTNALKRKPKAVKTKRIEMMLGSTTTRVEIYAASIKSLDQKFELEIEMSKVDKPELMKLNNPNYAHLLERYKHLNSAKFEDPDTQAKVIKEIFKAAYIEEDIMDLLLDKYPLPKVLRIGAWVRRFILNCKRQPAEREKERDPINSREVQQQREWWIRRAQDAVKHDARYLADRERLNLQENNLGILECRGRIIGEYVRGLHFDQCNIPKLEVKEDQKPRNTWKLAIVKQLITGRDGVIRAAKLKTAGGNNYLERAIQHLFPLELQCDKEIATRLDPDAQEFTPRQKRNAAAAATLRIRDIAEDEKEL
ncbi:Hypothetical predicted protein [Paramuricea clavata]|uniref:Uncharacterized protein n=1 Tax=Paramuricea clavata TaxID=317549 RepID=A0A6S7K339_PARCT|nr:Hypothetical predicted protein [Paramuricea clavata]